MGRGYAFDEDLAVEFGVDEAILIERLRAWIWYNRANKTNFHDGHTWTFNSARAWAELLPFWTASKIWRLLQRLVDEGVLLADNYNKVKYDRTLWYAFADEEAWVTERSKSPRSGVVYLVSAGMETKIGITTHPKKRLSTLRSSEGKAVELVCAFEVPEYRKVERQLHLLFAAQRVSGEWFTLSEGDIEKAKAAIAQSGGIHFTPVKNGSHKDEEPIPDSPTNGESNEEPPTPPARRQKARDQTFKVVTDIFWKMYEERCDGAKPIYQAQYTDWAKKMWASTKQDPALVEKVELAYFEEPWYYTKGKTYGFGSLYQHWNELLAHVKARGYRREAPVVLCIRCQKKPQHYSDGLCFECAQAEKHARIAQEVGA